MIYGAEVLTACLEALGVEHVFGLPGTQNLAIFEALRRARLRTVVASDEMAATFMASGYARAGGRLGVVTTISGPGFTYALTALAEARADSTPLLLITLRQHDNGRAFQLQRIDQGAIAAPLVKECVYIDDMARLPEAIFAAARTALRGEPGPVLVEVQAGLMSMQLERVPPLATGGADDRTVTAELPFDEGAFDAVAAAIGSARRPLLLVGQGAQGAAGPIRAWCEAHRIPLLATCSGRGVLPETHPLCLAKDFSYGVGSVSNEVIAAADLVLVLGCKLGHNGSGGYKLRLPAERLIHVDSSREVPGANYPARHTLVATCEEFTQHVQARGLAPQSDWTDAELTDYRERIARERDTAVRHEPRLAEGAGRVREFFDKLNAAHPANTIFVTDSGQNQALTRHYACVNATRGMIAPTDFQSMGFGLPAAIGARLARPQATVIACIGDGGFLQTATELLTATREGVALTVVVFNDGKFGYIERQQIEQFGVASGTGLGRVDVGGIADSMGCTVTRHPIDETPESHGPTIIHVPVTNPQSAYAEQLLRRVREALARAIKRRVHFRAGRK